MRREPKWQHSDATQQAGAVPTAIRRYSAARRSRKQIVLVLLLVLDYSISDYENEEEDEDKRFARLATIWTDTDSCGSRHYGFSQPKLTFVATFVLLLLLILLLICDYDYD